MAEIAYRNGGAPYWKEQELSDKEIRMKIEEILGRTEIPHVDYLINYYKTLYYHLTISRVPNKKETTDKLNYWIRNIDAIKKIANTRLQEHYGVEKAEDMLSVPAGYKVSDIPRGYPASNRSIADAFPISNEEIRERTSERPIIPIYRDGDLIRLIGMDSQTGRPVLFTLVFDCRTKDISATHTKLVLYMGGQETGLTNLSRPTYKPNSIHVDVVKDSNGIILTDSKGVALKKFIDPVLDEVHTYDMTSRLLDPHGYTAPISEQDAGYTLISSGGEKLALISETLPSGDRRTRKACFVDHLSRFCKNNNILCADMQSYFKNDQYGLQIDRLFPEDGMILNGANLDEFSEFDLDAIFYELALEDYTKAITAKKEEVESDEESETIDNSMEAPTKEVVPLPEGTQMKDEVVVKKGKVQITPYDYAKDNIDPVQ